MDVRYRGAFAYVDGELERGEVLPLVSVAGSYNGSARLWGFAIYLASKDGYQDSVLPRHARQHARGGPGFRLWAVPSATLAPGYSPPDSKPSPKPHPLRTSRTDH